MLERASAVLRRQRVRGAMAAGFSAVIFLGALWVLSRTLGRFDLDEVLAQARGYGGGELAAALLLSFASYFALCGFDWLAVRHLRRDVPGFWTALISFVSHAISHNAGFAALTGGSVRLRMYSAFGLSMGEVAGVIAFAGLTFLLGAGALSALAFITEGDKVARLLHLPPVAISGLGWLLALLLLIYVGVSANMRQPLALGPVRLSAPTLPVSLAQMLVAATDLALVAAALYVLLPLDASVSYPAFVGLYVVATLLGTLSHVPGGLGVFEGALLLLLPEVAPGAVLGGLLVFRVFYNLLPLLLAALVLAVFELVQRRRHRSDPAWLIMIGPFMASALVFAAGAVLLVTGAARPPSALPAWLAEPSHLLSAAAGGVLLASAYALARRAAWAWKLSLATLAVGAVLALGRGPDWIAAAFLAASAATLAAAAPLFPHPMRGDALPPGWVGAGAAVVLGAGWLTLHSGQGATLFRHLLSFAGDDEAARAMRGNVLAATALLAAALAGRLPLLPQRR